jgi:branched-chain amino acid transport system substrate-binding protein
MTASQAPDATLRQTGTAMFLQRRRTLLASATALLLAGATMLTACDGRADSTGAAAAPGCATPGVSSSEVRAGLLFSDSGGGQSAFGAFRAGVDARLGVANNEGGVNGRKIVYSPRDDVSDPAQNLARARDLVSVDQVFGVIEGSTEGTGSAQYLADQKVPVVGVGTDISWSQRANMFTWSHYTTESGSNSVWGDFVRREGGTRAVLVNLAASATTDRFNEQLTESLRAAGVQVDQVVNVTAQTTNFDDLVRRMKADGADTLMGSIFPDMLARLLPAARAAGVNLKVATSPLGYDRQLLSAIGPALAGTVVYLDFVPYEVNDAAHARLLGAMAKYAPEIQPAAQESAGQGWLSADIFLRGLAAAGPCPTRASFIEGLQAVHNYDGGGLLPGPVDFATNRSRLSSCYDFVRVSADGKGFVPLQPITQCGNPLN